MTKLTIPMNVDRLYEDCISVTHKAYSPGTMLWHYTSLETLIKIIETSTLQLSGFRFMNDPDEGRWASSAIERCWDLATKQVSNPRLDFGALRNELFPLSLEHPGTNEQTTFVFCMSELSDSLSQWARYGDNGRGVAIGLTVTGKNLSGWQKINGWTYGPFLTKVQYWDPDQTAPDGPMIVDIAQKLVRFLSEATHPVEVQNGLLQAADAVSATVKSAGYEEEREWRIYAKADSSATSAYHVKANAFGIAPVLELPLMNSGIGLSQIIFGPKLGNEVLGIFPWLRDKFGINVAMTRSKLRYR